MDRMVKQAAKVHYMSGGKLKVPIFRTTLGATRRSAAQHSQSLQAWVSHVPGLKVALPSTPYDAKGLWKTAIRDDNPVVIFEDKLMYQLKGPVPEGEYTIPFGTADVKREGRDITIVATSSMVQVALQAADLLAPLGISAEVVDPRTTAPLDARTLVESARKTSRVIVMDEGYQRYGVTAERLARVRKSLAASELGALLFFDMNNIRYITATHIGTWAMDKLVRFTLLPRGDEPILWDFGSAARHHQLYNPWLGERSRAGISTLRGAYPQRATDVARKIRVELEARKLHRAPLGVDVIEIPVLEALRAEGLTVVDGQHLMQEVRKIKTQDEITLLATACMMVDAAYEELYRVMRPGMRENECVGLVSKVLYDLGSEHVEGVNAISGERCNPHPHVYTDRVLRPGDPAYFDILHSFMGYRTCYYRTFVVGSASPAQVDAYTRCREHLDTALGLIKPGVSTADVVKVWPKAAEFGFPNEEAAFALQYGHGVGLSIWEKPIFSRLVSIDYPEIIEEGMVFALETFWPATDGWSAARIEEQIVVTKSGCEGITRFPAEQLLVAGTRYQTAGGPLPATRETQSNLNRAASNTLEAVVTNARQEGSRVRT